MENGSVRVTLADVYAEVKDLRRHVESLPATVQDHERRIRNAERVLWMAVGIAVASPVAITLIG